LRNVNTIGGNPMKMRCPCLKGRSGRLREVTHEY
jgi:hypothetical protein